MCLSENKFQELNGDAGVCTVEFVVLVKKKSTKKCTDLSLLHQLQQ